MIEHNSKGGRAVIGVAIEWQCACDNWNQPWDNWCMRCQSKYTGSHATRRREVLEPRGNGGWLIGDGMWLLMNCRKVFEDLLASILGPDQLNPTIKNDDTARMTNALNQIGKWKALETENTRLNAELSQALHLMDLAHEANVKLILAQRAAQPGVE